MTSLKKTRPPDPQVIQSILMRIMLKDFFAAVRRLTDNSDMMKPLLDNCAVLLDKNIFIDSEYKYCPKEKALPLAEMTVGELLSAADNCLSRRFTNDPYIITLRPSLIDGVGKTIMERLLIVPLASVCKYKAFKAAEADEQPEKDGDDIR